MNWQPIETAPREGSFLAYGWEGQAHGCQIVFIDDDGTFCVCDYSQEPTDYLPTHWMPLPKSPEATK